MDKLRSIEMPYHPPSLDSGSHYDRGNMASNFPPALHQSPLASPTDAYRAKSLPEDMKAAFLLGAQQSLGAESTGSAADLLPPGYQVPQSILLQQEYDRRKQTMSPESQDGGPLGSDPAKLAELQPSGKGEAGMTSPPGKASNTPPAGSRAEESELQSDPDKLRALRLFDAQNAMSKPEKEPGDKSGKNKLDSHFDHPPSDPNKLQHLMVFDAQNAGLQAPEPKETEHSKPCEQDVRDGKVPISFSETDPKRDHAPISSSHTPMSPGHTPTSYSHTPASYSHTPSSYSHVPTSLGPMPTPYGHTPTFYGHASTSPDSGTGSKTPTPVENAMESRQGGEAKDPMKQKMMDLFDRYEKMKAGDEENGEGEEAEWPQEG